MIYYCSACKGPGNAQASPTPQEGDLESISDNSSFDISTTPGPRGNQPTSFKLPFTIAPTDIYSLPNGQEMRINDNGIKIQPRKQSPNAPLSPIASSGGASNNSLNPNPNFASTYSIARSSIASDGSLVFLAGTSYAPSDSDQASRQSSPNQKHSSNKSPKNGRRFSASSIPEEPS